MQVRASDIHIEPQEHKVLIRFRIDGMLHIQTEADSKIASALTLRLKLMSGLDISEKRLPQDGRFNIKVRNRSDRRAHFDHAHAAWRIRRNAPAQPERRHPGPRAHWIAQTHARPTALSHPSSQRNGAGDRSDRQRQDDHSVCRARGIEHVGTQDHHRGRPGGISPARDQSGADPRKNRPDVQQGAAHCIASGSGCDPGR